MLKTFLKQLLCRHNYEMIRWHLVHFPLNEPLSIEAEYICSKCGKKKWVHFERGWEKEFRRLFADLEER